MNTDHSYLNYALSIATEFRQWPVAGWVFFGIGCYVAVSYFFLQFPKLLHNVKRFPPSLLVRHSSHRGGAAERTENSLAAFRHAVSLGSQLLEMDVHMTSDGVPVVIHDASLTRLCGQALEVRNVPYAELPRLLGHLAPPFPFNKEGKVNWTEAERIPTLKEVFESFPTSCFNIDCKVFDQELARKLDRLIAEHKMEDRVIWGSGSDGCSQFLYSVNPRINRFFSVKQMLLTVLKYYTGILPFCKINETAFEIPILTSTFRRNIEHAAATRNRKILGWIAIKLASTILSSTGLFRHLQKRGIKVILWVANEDEDFETAYKKFGVDGVMTDFPSRLTTYLSHNDPAFSSFNNKQK